MPKERKQRGRRKKKEEEDEVENAPEHTSAPGNAQQDNFDGPDEDGEHGANFFGLLDESEQTYFKTIDDAMIADEFTTSEEKDIFVENVYKEAEGKELKLATSPLGSKVLEQLLARSKPAQVRKLFQNYQGNFHTLVRQRYASHVCEMLFAIASSLISAEMSRPIPTDNEDSGEPYVSMENLFLYMFNEISNDIAILAADVYASHVIRDTLLILQGTLFIFEEAKGQAKRYHGQKKFSWARPDKKLPVPSSFKDALSGVMSTLTELPSAQLRMTASQPYSVSFVQVLIALEADLKSGDDRPILFSLLGGRSLDERDDYMESILREPSGSKLFETIITSLPESHFAKFYETYFRGRAAKFAHNPITNFVLQKLLATCQSPDIIAAIQEELQPVLKDLVQLNHMQVIQKLVEASIRTQSQPTDLFDRISEAFDCGPGSDRTQLIPAILETPAAVSIESSDAPPRRTLSAAATTDVDAGKVYNMQGAFLIRSLLGLPDPSFAMLASGLLECPPETLVSYAMSHAALKVLDTFLAHPHTTLLHRKRILNALAGSFVALARHPVGSHFVDACWAATTGPGLKLYKDRIAAELAADADAVRGHYYGRIVWRNWHMDEYRHRRGDWNALIRQETAKQSALTRLGRGDTADPAPSRAPAAVEVHADRASMIQQSQEQQRDPQGSRRDRKRTRKHRKDEGADEVDDIFKRRKL
ncbi:Nucleolar protein 9 [Taphrina deformans PYCC 5710]|uniref:Nucleolar protein 9 n=1 Tax=Taphrina deformans (strain PYCC 5710 / ATCC 11124 / CBS 356.35 / IMI 108563 / JCM 9778 / NBRC 8474) TaxID=1097556 RepID=R4X943_TAPDE|nr:Nucleolar protein 9 [Taphrina deformans PYCC 5710]|eukprot:CCG80682.1 Nucleolar protein 9 [Taphrina deformans PYCC 5710]